MEIKKRKVVAQFQRRRATLVHQDASYNKKQKPRTLRYGVIRFRYNSIWRCPTLTWGNPTLPSALRHFTSEFGMESGRTTALWSPEYSVDDILSFSFLCSSLL